MPLLKPTTAISFCTISSGFSTKIISMLALQILLTVSIFLKSLSINSTSLAPISKNTICLDALTIYSTNKCIRPYLHSCSPKHCINIFISLKDIPHAPPMVYSLACNTTFHFTFQNTYYSITTIFYKSILFAIIRRSFFQPTLQIWIDLY